MWPLPGTTGLQLLAPGPSRFRFALKAGREVVNDAFGTPGALNASFHDVDGWVLRGSGGEDKRPNVAFGA